MFDYRLAIGHGVQHVRARQSQQHQPKPQPRKSERFASICSSCQSNFMSFVSCFFLKQVPIYFSCYGECCDVVLLWNLQNWFFPLQNFPRLSIGMRVSRSWLNFHIWVNFSFKTHLTDRWACLNIAALDLKITYPLGKLTDSISDPLVLSMWNYHMHVCHVYVTHSRACSPAAQPMIPKSQFYYRVTYIRQVLPLTLHECLLRQRKTPVWQYEIAGPVTDSELNFTRWMCFPTNCVPRLLSPSRRSTLHSATDVYLASSKVVDTITRPLSRQGKHVSTPLWHCAHNNWWELVFTRFLH